MAKLGILDIGTNSIHMILAEVEPDFSYKVLDRFKDMTRLGDALLKVSGAIRINYAIFGNVEPALHAHVIPRYLDEPEDKRTAHPWAYDWNAAPAFDRKNMEEFAESLRRELNRMGVTKPMRFTPGMSSRSSSNWVGAASFPTMTMPVTPLRSHPFGLGQPMPGCFDQEIARGRAWILMTDAARSEETRPPFARLERRRRFHGALADLAGCGEARRQVVPPRRETGPEVVEDQAETVGVGLLHDVVDEVEVDRLAVRLQRQEALSLPRLALGDLLRRIHRSTWTRAA